MKWRELFINEIEDIHLKAVLSMLYTGVQYEKRLESMLRPFNISHQQFEVLKILELNSPDVCSLKYIQNRLINQTANTTRLVEKLRLKSLIKTSPSKENRSRLDISITPSGMKLLKEIEIPLSQFRAGLRQTMSETEAKTLSSILPKIQDFLLAD